MKRTHLSTHSASLRSRFSPVCVFVCVCMQQGERFSTVWLEF
uniref:Uncharacterized protein n=1 Tax=Arundo donax TaxID=35708 RepID=A0A0A9CB26_ARUDO